MKQKIIDLTLNNMNNKNIKMVIRDAYAKQWLEFSNPIVLFEIFDPAEIISVLDKIDHWVNVKNKYAAGFISYEAAAAFDHALKTHPSQQFPLLYFGIYEKPTEVQPSFSTEQNDNKLVWQAETGMDKYNDNINNIKELIASGQTYQINYTLRLRAEAAVNPMLFFREMFYSQQARYGAYINTGKYAVCSASPELFFELNGDEITAIPMKGTAARGKTVQEDEIIRQELAASTKNRAENVMIVDMIRNDFSRICKYGSVHVPQLFRVEKYPTVWQMVSDVKGKTDAKLSELFSALFPCASITGAPKVKTMSFIRDLEKSPRKIYTGSIGFLMPGRRAQFNVAIRTLLINQSTNKLEYGIGGGIVWDSTAKDEYDEALLKAQVILNPHPQFELLETMRVDDDGTIFLLEYHLKRLRDSAKYFDYPYNEKTVRKRLFTEIKVKETTPYILRMLLNKKGEYTFEKRELAPLNDKQKVQLKFADSPINKNDTYLYHKTTRRAVYEQAKNGIDHCDDVILWNENMDITEATIANIVIKENGIYYTPPLNSGLLGGTYRQWLLESGKILERTITKDQLRKAKGIYLINSVRKWREAVLK